VEDILTYAMFPKVAPKFFAERAKGPISSDSFALPKQAAPTSPSAGGSYTVTVNGTSHAVTTGAASGDSVSVTVDGTAYNVTFGAAGTSSASAPASAPAPAAPAGGEAVNAPVAGTVLKNIFSPGSKVNKGDVIMIIESMKMELEIKAPCAGSVQYLCAPGTQISAGQPLAKIQ
jgi:oxaloacetate decarboxylase alpha subunit